MIKSIGITYFTTMRVTIHYYPAVRTGSSNTRFFLLFSIFLVVICPRPPVFARPNILVASFATQARACILSDHNIFCTPRGGGNGGVMPLGLFRSFIFLWSLAPDLRFSLGQRNTQSCLSLHRLGLLS